MRPGLPDRAVSVIITAALVPTLLWRRTRPLLMVAIAFGVCAIAPLIIGNELGNKVFAFVLLLAYALFRWGSGREAILGSAIMASKIVLAAALGNMSLGDLVGGFVVLALVGTLGLAVRFRARARTRELEQVKLLERERLARDLHDTVAHHVSALAIRAQAGLVGTAPNAAEDALRVIEAEASKTLTEMRMMVRVLRRDEPAELLPTPGVRDLEQLAGSSRPGPEIEVELTGDLNGLPPSVGAAIYRLAQESITNARRHARHATRITVRVAADASSVRLEVSDDGEASPVRSPGYGLIGMSERADLLGGSFMAGPRPDRGWAVTAVLPRAAS